MAGRPASGSGGGTIGIIAFAITTALALGAFIWQYTQNETLKSQADQFQATLAEYGTPPRTYASEAQNRGATVFATMDQERQAYAEAISGNPNSIWDVDKITIERVLNSVAEVHADLIDPQSTTLVTAIERLSAILAAEKETRQRLDRDLRDARDELSEQVELVDRLRGEYEEDVQNLTAEYQAERERTNERLATANDQAERASSRLEQLGQELEQLRSAVESGQSDKDLAIAALQAQLRDAQNRLDEFQPPLFDPTTILRKADGSVMRAVPGSDFVYINRGSADGIRVGMGFEVFSPFYVPRDDFRGKASLVVVAIGEKSAECRVTRSERSRPVLEGDPIVNLAYEEGRRPKFVVRGDFDLDYDGQPDPGGADTIADLIRRWGGQVAADLDETTDFVVIGTAPFLPPYERGVSEFERTNIGVQNELQRIKRAGFESLVDRAVATYVPVLTQSQFLFLSGYTLPDSVVRD